MKKPNRWRNPGRWRNPKWRWRDDEDEKGETWVFKTQIPRGFLSTSSTTPYKSRLKNLIFILELEFWTLEMLVSNIVLQRDN